MSGTVVSVSLSPRHSFSKPEAPAINLLAGLGVEGDAHCGALVQQRYRRRKDPNQTNLSQVHLLQSELLDELASKGFAVAPGDMGENITTCGIDLLALPPRTILSIGDDAVLEVTGLRDPCVQMNKFRPGLMQAVLERGQSGEIIRKSGIMAIVNQSGNVHPGDEIHADLPPRPWQPLVCV